jgi:ribosome-binding protein aMBF1 (putative translation factor)
VHLDEPFSRQLSGKLRELRFYLARRQVRVTYYIATGRRIVLLTVFAKTRPRETREVLRAEEDMQRCIREGHVAEEGRMTATRKSWEDIKASRGDTEGRRRGYEKAGRAIRLAFEIRALREARGLSQRDLAELVGTTQSAIARLEGGHVSPTLATLDRIAEALNVELSLTFVDLGL